MTNLFFEKVGRGQHVGWKGAESLLFSIDAGFGFLDGIAGFLVLISMGDLVLTTTTKRARMRGNSYNMA